jgi:hypothetical protein
MVKDLAWLIFAGVLMPTMVFVLVLRQRRHGDGDAPLHADAGDVARMDADKG